MKTRFLIHSIIFVLLAGLMLSSCGNIDIVKRRYRPGFHVDITKKKSDHSVRETDELAESRSVVGVPEEENQPVSIQPIKAEQAVVASASSVATAAPTKSSATKSQSKLMSMSSFKNLSFDRKMSTIKNEVFKAPPRGGGMEWMKWVAFGTGIASMVFGFLAVLFAFLLASSYFIWPAMIFSAAAIVFAVLYKKNNGTDPKGKLGFIFGIVGGGLAVIALIIWAIWVGLAIGAVI